MCVNKPSATEIMFSNIKLKELWEIPNDLLETAYKARKYRWKNHKKTTPKSVLKEYKREIKKICKQRFDVKRNVHCFSRGLAACW